MASIQLRIGGCSKQERVDRVVALLDETNGCDLVLLPEIWPTGYFAFSRYADEAESMDGAIVRLLRRKAASVKQYLFMGSMVECDGGSLFNTSILINSEGGLVARYRKIHLFGYQSDESKLLQRGNEVVVAETPWGRFGISTCYDLRFPELYRKMIDQGAEGFLVCAAWPHARLEAWRLFNRSRAHENLAWLLSCNCAGMPLGGHSMCVNPLGQIVAEAGEEEEILHATIDMSAVKRIRSDFTALDDRVLR